MARKRKQKAKSAGAPSQSDQSESGSGPGPPAKQAKSAPLQIGSPAPRPRPGQRGTKVDICKRCKSSSKQVEFALDLNLVQAEPDQCAQCHGKFAAPISIVRFKEGKTKYKPAVLRDCNQILPFLYLGGVDAVADTQLVFDQGIRAVVCCLRDVEFPATNFSKDLEYHRVDVEDISREPIELFFPDATAFIHSRVSRKLPVLVHCRAGVSRSASVVMAYLMEYRGYSLIDAFFLVRSLRSCVTPNLGFMEKLCDYEEAQQQTETTIDINKYTSWWFTTEGRAAVPDLSPE